jgi:hypothetical protein
MPSLCNQSPWWDVLYIMLIVLIITIVLEIVIAIPVFLVTKSNLAVTIVSTIVGFVAPIYLIYSRTKQIRADCHQDYKVESADKVLEKVSSKDADTI